MSERTDSGGESSGAGRKLGYGASTMRDAVDVVVIGAGPVGTLIANDLIVRYNVESAARVLRVLWVIRNAANRDGFMRYGLMMERGDEIPPSQATAKAPPARILTNELGLIDSIEDVATLVPNPDAVIVCVKAYSLDEVLANVRRLFPDSPTLIIANGIHSINDVFGGVFFGGARLAEEGRLILTKQLDLVWGNIPDPMSDLVERNAIADGLIESQALIFHVLFGGDGVVTYRYERDIRRTMLAKAIVNSVINPLTAIIDAPNEIILDECLQPLVRGLVSEACDAIDAAGVDDEDSSKRQPRMFNVDAEYANVLQVARDTGSNISSMLQDVRAGRPTETPWLNGRIVELGRMFGAETPLHEWIKGMIGTLGGREQV